jgi:hypothetical protein
MMLKIELGISNQDDVVYMWCPNWHVSEMWNVKWENVKWENIYWIKLWALKWITGEKKMDD